MKLDLIDNFWVNGSCLDSKVYKVSINQLIGYGDKKLFMKKIKSQISGTQSSY